MSECILDEMSLIEVSIQLLLLAAALDREDASPKEIGKMVAALANRIIEAGVKFHGLDNKRPLQ